MNTDHILHVFSHMYPHDTIDITFSDDRKILVVDLERNEICFRAVIDQDPTYLYFTPFDDDDAPADDDHEYLTVRCRREPPANEPKLITTFAARERWGDASMELIFADIAANNSRIFRVGLTMYRLI